MENKAPYGVNNVIAYTPLPQPKPDPMAFFGLAGDYVRTIEPDTEADPVALLVHFLLFYGSIINRTSYQLVESTHHSHNEFAVFVGETALGRKGTAKDRALKPFAELDPDWKDNCIKYGIASGEGIIYNLRDAQGQDPGITDKRLTIVEPEFSQILQVAKRQGNTVTSVLRAGWDSGSLSTLTKNNPNTATNAHLSVIGHTTSDELRRDLDDTSRANGFANRFLWVFTKRSKILPEGGSDVDLSHLTPRLSNAVNHGRKKGFLQRDSEARKLWAEVYPALSDGKPGLLGAVISRAEAHTLRLSGIYALLDCSESIREEHLQAALSLWKYCEDSARYIFGDAIGDPIADRILSELRVSPNGMTRNEIRNLFQRNRSSDDIDKSLSALLNAGLIRVQKEETGGRPAERFYAIKR